MAKLILSVDGQVLKEHVLSKERTLIGRKPHNDIQIDNLAVSGEHAAIITILNDSFIEDLGSTNGTMVNGKPVKKHFLQANDVIEIGKHKLKYFNDAPSQTSPADFEKTMIIRSPSKPAAPPPPPQQPAAAAPSVPTGPAPAVPPAAERVSSDTVTNMKAMAPEVVKAAPPPPTPTAHADHAPLPDAAIQVLSGAAAGRTLDLTKNLTTIGKPGLQVAVITKRPNGYFITHVEGASFPTLNGASLGAQAHPLADHDMIEIAGVKMEFFFKP
jgi:pSer/pThr/pTyr-binding forkhead associated (FHA) protein